MNAENYKEYKRRFRALLDISGCTVEQICSSSRKRAFNICRYIIWTDLHDMGVSLPEIGQLFNRDHATVVHGIHKLEQMIGVGSRSYGMENDIYERYMKRIEISNELTVS